ncbi:RHS repeat-associated core domain-containing protein [Microbulbifer epialgicus]|uniref:RHS repeat-associated core domain-containing protein n=1 Tax=Microbulbifer epialgicus TaxID=393907 RepID=A0ABV4P6H4_9GAMM
MTSWGNLRTAFVGLCASFLLHAASAHDFGGSSAGDPPPGPPEPPSCERSSGQCCNSGGGSGNGDGGAGGSEDGAVGDPIHAFDGSFYLNDTDLEVGSYYPIRLVRRFDSRSQFDSAIGYGWAFDHDRRLFEYPDGSALIRSGCGRRNTFVFTGGAYVTPRDAPQGTLTEHADGSYTFEYANGNRDKFDADGRLVSIFNKKGQSHQLTYDERGRLPLVGTSPNSVDPDNPMVVAYQPRLTRIEERGADGGLTGAAVDFYYNEDTGRLTHVIASDGRRIDYSHDELNGATRGNLLEVSGLDSYQHSFKYEDAADANRITGLQRGVEGAWVTNTYDSDGRVIKQIEGQNTIELDYVETGTTQITETVKTISGEVLDIRNSTFIFDEAGYLVQRNDPLGNEYRQVYNDAKDRIRTEYWEKQGDDLILLTATDYTYNGQAQKTSENTTLASGEVITRSWAYDHGWMTSEETVSSKEPGKVFRTEYTFIRDAQNQPINIASVRQRKDDNSYAITTYTYCNGEANCPDSALIRQVDGPRTDVQDIVTYSYYDTTDFSGCDNGGNCYRKGDLKRIINALGHSQEFLTYNVEGSATQTRDANGLVTTYSYHPRGWLLEKRVLGADSDSSEDDLVTTYEYDSRGNVTKVSESNGNIQLFSYDARNRRIEKEDAEGNKTKYTLDSQGNKLVEETYDGEGNLKSSLSQSFDELNRTKQILIAQQQTTNFSYDAMDRMILSTDANGINTQLSYDGLGRLIQVIKDSNSLAVSTQFGYDALGRKTEVIDPRGNSTRYEYDLAGNLTKLISPDTGISSHTYDPSGNLISSTDARNIVRNFTYDILNRLTGISYPDNPSENVTFTYDDTSDGNNGVGRLTGYSNDAGSSMLTYDTLGRITQQDDAIASWNFRTLYSYDSEGRVSSITYPSGRIVRYSRDTFGRISAITSQESAEAIAQTIVSNVQYDSLMGISSMEYGNGITQSYSYDQAGRLQAINATGIGDIQSQVYSYDQVNNVTRIVDNLEADKTRSFTYDNLRRLTDENYLERKSSYQYDPVGNRTQQTSTELDQTTEVTSYNYEGGSNRLTEKAGKAWVIDAVGNTISHSDAAYQYTYNHANRLRTYRENGALLGTYYYNALGQRVRTDKDEDSLLHYNLNGQYLSETNINADGNTIKSQVDYIYLGDMPVAQAEIHYSEGDVSSSTITYLHSDHLNTPRIGTNDNTVVWRWDSDAFGHLEPNMDPDGDLKLIEVNLRFPGQIKGREAPHYYNYFRDYDPNNGRYLQSDPIGLNGGLNTFAYVEGNPLSFIDPKGLSVKRLGDLYGDMINPFAPGCEEPIWSGGYIVGWKPCEKPDDPGCSGDDKQKDGWDDYKKNVEKFNDALQKDFPDPSPAIEDALKELQTAFDEVDRKSEENMKECGEAIIEWCARLKGTNTLSKNAFGMAACIISVGSVHPHCDPGATEEERERWRKPN